MIRTGEQYIESIRDGRQVYVNGEIVKDVPSHPMFKPLVDSAGGLAAYTGRYALGVHAHAISRDAVSGGNLLASKAVPDAIVNAFALAG